MASRRAVLGGLLATGLAPKSSWADVGSPAYVTAALRPDGIYTLCGLTQDGALVFEAPLPDRGHAAATHPYQPKVVAFARRPGTFAFVIDCTTGRQIARIDAPTGRHFYGHGTFSADGSVLYTTENDYDAALGMIGVWDARKGYRRIGEFSSGGVGPHDILRLPSSDTLVVANGGIETHPDSGRAKLNVPTMRPNLSYVGHDGALIGQFVLDEAFHLNSIRHLDVSTAGLVAFATQWQGDPSDAPALLGLHQLGHAATWVLADPAQHVALEGYAGSVSFSGDQTCVGITSPRGGLIQVFSVADGTSNWTSTSPDASVLSRHAASGFCFTNGTGAFGHVDAEGVLAGVQIHDRAFDNHLVRIDVPG